jgi:hypothetical protein
LDHGRPPEVPGVGGELEAEQDAGQGSPRGEVALADAVERAGHAATRHDHPDAEEQPADDEVEPERHDVGAGWERTERRVRHGLGLEEGEQRCGDRERDQDRAHHRAVAHQVEVAEGAGEAEASPLEGDAQRQTDQPVQRQVRVDDQGKRDGEGAGAAKGEGPDGRAALRGDRGSEACCHEGELSGARETGRNGNAGWFARVSGARMAVGGRCDGRDSPSLRSSE